MKESIKKANKRFVEVAKNIGEVVSIISYGSVARDEGGEGSDVDLLVLLSRNSGNEWKLLEAAAEVGSETMELINPFIATMDEFIDNLKLHNPFALNIVKEGRVLYGRKSWERILAHAPSVS
ncbi:MAG: nucleotidyltransferase domain-containing protein [Candidatus Hydrothermarchaeales archaeon]